MHENNSIDFNNGSIWKSLSYFAIPIFLGSLFQTLYALTDTIIIGQFAGKTALAAIESVFTLTRFPITFFNGLASGATIIISQYYGAKKLDKVSNASHNAIFFSIIGSITLAIINILVTPFAIDLIDVPSAIVTDAKLYITIYLVGMAPSLIYNVGAGILRALGNSKTPFHILVITNIINIILDIILVVLLKLSVFGAAMATFLSAILSAILILIYLFKTNRACKLYLKNLGFYKNELFKFIALGLPIAIQSILYPIGNTVIQYSINGFGITKIAAWSVVYRMDLLIWYISDSFSPALSAFVGQNYGANNMKRAREGIRASLIITIVLTTILSIPLYFNSDILARIFINDASVIKEIIIISVYLAPTYFIYPLSEILPAAIRGTGETFKPMILGIIGTCIIRVAWIAFVVPIKPTVLNALTSYPVSWLFTAIIFIPLYYKTFSKN